jgi:transcriptional regulator with XRE-family HTH domain
MNKRSDNLAKFGQRIIQLRKQKGFSSQITFANKAKMDRTYIGGIERGERNPTFEILEKLAKTLGVRIEDLFKF